MVQKISFYLFVIRPFPIPFYPDSKKIFAELRASSFLPTAERRMRWFFTKTAASILIRVFALHKCYFRVQSRFLDMSDENWVSSFQVLNIHYVVGFSAIAVKQLDTQLQLNKSLLYLKFIQSVNKVGRQVHKTINIWNLLNFLCTSQYFAINIEYYKYTYIVVRTKTAGFIPRGLYSALLDINHSFILHKELNYTDSFASSSRRLYCNQ